MGNHDVLDSANDPKLAPKKDAHRLGVFLVLAFNLLNQACQGKRQSFQHALQFTFACASRQAEFPASAQQGFAGHLAETGGALRS